MLVLFANDAVASTIIPFAQDDNQRRTVCRLCLASDMSTADLASGQTGRARCQATACSWNWAMEYRIPGLASDMSRANALSDPSVTKHG